MLEQMPPAASTEHERDPGEPDAAPASAVGTGPAPTADRSGMPEVGGEGEGGGGPDLPVRSVEEIEHLLDGVEAALARLDEGSYGTCTSCGGPIEESRLEALPVATRCGTCPEDGAGQAAHPGESG